LQQISTSIDGLPAVAEDIDVLNTGEWVAICKRDGALVVATANGHFIAPNEIRYPMIRWASTGDILVIDSRTSKGRDNAFLFSPSGKPIANFCVGDGVADVIAVGDHLVFTYFDEGVFSGIAPSHEGLCCFTSDGRFEFGYQSTVISPVDIADCYCACAVGCHEVCFVPYTKFPLVRLNLKTRTQEVYQLPQELAGASAIASDGVDFLLYGPYDAKRSIFRWRPESEPLQIGTCSGPLRGFDRLAFLSKGTAGYTIVSESP
jgi:hypothetical protein